jgi:uncharacterized membrane protein YqjE
MELFNLLANGVSVRELTDPFYGINWNQVYYALLDLMFYVIILVGILWQFRRNGKKIKLLEIRVSELEKKKEGK